MEFELEGGLRGGGVHGLLGADNVEGLADGGVVAGVFFDAADEEGDAAKDVWGHGVGGGAEVEHFATEPS